MGSYRLLGEGKDVLLFFLFVYVYMCMQEHMHAHHFFNHFSIQIFFLSHGLSLNLEITDSTRLGSQKASRHILALATPALW